MNHQTGKNKISSRMQTTIQEFLDSEQKFSSFFAAMTDVVIIYDKDGRYQEIAATNTNQLYKDPSELLGKTIFEIFPTELANRTIQVIHKVIDTGNLEVFEYWLPIGEREVWFTANVSKISPDLVIWVARDITEHKLALQKVRENEARLVQAQAVSQTGSWELDLKTQLYWGSKEALRIYGLPRETSYLTREQIRSVTAVEDHPRLNAAMRSLINDHKPYDIEFRLQKSGEPAPRIIHSIATLEFDSEGQPARVVGVLQDITERKLVERSLRESEENFRTFFNTVDELLFILDEGGNVLFCNDSVIDRLGYSEAELIGKSVLHIHPPERRDEAADIVAKILAGTADSCPIPVMTKDGHLIPVETRVCKGVWNGKPVIYGVTKDISRIQESEEMFSKVFNANPVPMAVSTADSKFIDVNEAFLRTLGFTRDEVIGKTSSELKVFVDIEERNAVIAELKERGTARNHIVRIRTRSGEQRVGEFFASFLRLQNQTCLLTVMLDVTEKKRLEEDLIYRNTHDSLTGLYNRQYYETEIIRLQNSRLFPISLMMLDVDELKFINDTYGHDAGDELLRRIAAILKSTFRPEDMVARMGGDEFVVVLPETDEKTAAQIRNRLEKVVEKHNTLFPPEMALRISIGSATGTTGTRLTELFKQADKAMYLAKSTRKNGVL